MSDFAFSSHLFVQDAAEGMYYMHESNPVILHRDLKSDNLLVTGDLQVLKVSL